MARKAIAPHIADSSAEFIGKTFSTLNSGSTYIIDAFPALYKRSLQDLKGVFSKNELMLMIDVFNSTALTAQMAGQHLLAQVADGIELDALDEKWEIDKKTLLEKIEKLPIFALACLEIWANGFWYADEKSRAKKDLSGRDMDEWMKSLL